MTSTYVHTYTALHASSNQMLTKCLTDLWIGYGAAGTNQIKPQVIDSKAVVAKCIPVVFNNGQRFLKFIAESFITTYFEQLAVCSHAGQSPFLAV